MRLGVRDQRLHLADRLAQEGMLSGTRGDAPARIQVVRTIEELFKVRTVRALVYMADQGCPYGEEFDGNDLCALHLLALAGEEPAASLRIRFFSDFAKVERLAVRPAYRQSTIAFRIVRYGLRLIARKGYRRAYGHAQAGLEPFWSRFGAKQIGATAAFSFSGHAYTEMLVELPEHPQALRIGADPLVLNRPEGDWETAGVLESSTGSMAEAGREEPVWPDRADSAWRRWAGGR